MMIRSPQEDFSPLQDDSDEDLPGGIAAFHRPFRRSGVSMVEFRKKSQRLQGAGFVGRQAITARNCQEV
jgi:hypothetical protein